jgi:pimeloyl-ACP methyl ester carboxylesterase
MRQDYSFSFDSALNKSILVDGITFAYRELGKNDAPPILLLNHWGATLDNFDPNLLNGLSLNHRVIAIDYKGIGLSTGTAPVTVSEMADDTISLVRAMGFEKVNLLGFSLGGFVAQDIALKAPSLVGKLILAGTGPAGGDGIGKVWSVTWPLMIKGLLTFTDPKTYLFFTSTKNGKIAAKGFLARLKQRTLNRDKGPTLRAFFNQLRAINFWARQERSELNKLHMPVLIVNGDSDIMVPTKLSHDMGQRIPNSEVVIFEDAGHGAVFQYSSEFLEKALRFLSS